MPQKPGKQKRDAKRKKKREARHKARFGGKRGKQAASTTAPTASAPTATADLRDRHGYDADRTTVEGWLLLDERERLDRVARYHLVALTKDKLPPNMDRHAGLHVAVEDQLASGEPPEARRALQQLVGDGMSRHDAVHAIGWVMTKHMRDAMEKRAVDNDAYLADLSGLTLKSWLEMAGVER